jgi:lysine 6-dehydrogenase
MTHYLVLGAGMQGTAAAYDLIEHGGAQALTLADADPARLQAAARRLAALTGFGGLLPLRLDAADPRALAAAMQPADVCLSALPYRFALEVTRAALDARTHLLDLGGNTELALQQAALQAAHPNGAELSVLPDCGLMPGLGNLLVSHALLELGDLASCHLRCGGLPQHPRPPLDYQLVFSADGLINEYFGTAEVLRAGRLEQVPTFSGLESLEVQGLGRLEAFITSGGLSTVPRSFAGRICELDYKTARYPGHFEKFKLLLDLGLLEERPIDLARPGEAPAPFVPRRLLAALLARKLDFPDSPDLAFLRLTARAAQSPRALQYELIDRQDPRTGFTAMERTTAFSAAACAALVAKGQVPPGVRPLELAVDPRAFVLALAERGLPIEVREWTA